MLPDLDLHPRSRVVCPPYEAFVLEGSPPCLRGGMNAPLVRWRELLDGFIADEDEKGLFTEGPRGKGPDRGPFFFWGLRCWGRHAS